jgi:hypothetical protein
LNHERGSACKIILNYQKNIFNNGTNVEGKRPLGRPRRRWVDNIKNDLREKGWNRGDWIDLAQSRDQWRALVKAVMNLRVP